jgi:hypothetical protein
MTGVNATWFRSNPHRARPSVPRPGALHPPAQLRAAPRPPCLCSVTPRLRAAACAPMRSNAAAIARAMRPPAVPPRRRRARPWCVRHEVCSASVPGVARPGWRGRSHCFLPGDLARTIHHPPSLKGPACVADRPILFSYPPAHPCGRVLAFGAASAPSLRTAAWPCGGRGSPCDARRRRGANITYCHGPVYPGHPFRLLAV